MILAGRSFFSLTPPKRILLLLLSSSVIYTMRGCFLKDKKESKLQVEKRSESNFHVKSSSFRTCTFDSTFQQPCSNPRLQPTGSTADAAASNQVTKPSTRCLSATWSTESTTNNTISVRNSCFNEPKLSLLVVALTSI